MYKFLKPMSIILIAMMTCATMFAQNVNPQSESSNSMAPTELYLTIYTPTCELQNGAQLENLLKVRVTWWATDESGGSPSTPTEHAANAVKVAWNCWKVTCYTHTSHVYKAVVEIEGYFSKGYSRCITVDVPIESPTGNTYTVDASRKWVNCFSVLGEETFLPKPNPSVD
jgi:hypothetical protein